MIGRLFHKSCTLRGVRKLLIRHGFSIQMPGNPASR
ncbi:winged helix-turn-helix domain-containing protein [Streptomyces aquilus]